MHINGRKQTRKPNEIFQMVKCTVGKKSGETKWVRITSLDSVVKEGLMVFELRPE